MLHIFPTEISDGPQEKTNTEVHSSTKAHMTNQHSYQNELGQGIEWEIKLVWVSLNTEGSAKFMAQEFCAFLVEKKKKKKKKAVQAPNPVSYSAGGFYKVLWIPWGNKE